MDGWLIQFNVERSSLYPLFGPGWRSFGWEMALDGSVTAPKTYKTLREVTHDARIIKRTWPELRVRIREK